jgi:hypothetical protein
VNCALRSGAALEAADHRERVVGLGIDVATSKPLFYATQAAR